MPLINIGKRLVASQSGQRTATAGRRRLGLNRLSSNIFTGFSEKEETPYRIPPPEPEPDYSVPGEDYLPGNLYPEEPGIPPVPEIIPEPDPLSIVPDVAPSTDVPGRYDPDADYSVGGVDYLQGDLYGDPGDTHEVGGNVEGLVSAGSMVDDPALAGRIQLPGTPENPDFGFNPGYMKEGAFDSLTKMPVGKGLWQDIKNVGGGIVKIAEPIINPKSI